MLSSIALAGLGCLVLLKPPVVAPEVVALRADAIPTLQFVQEKGIQGQDPTTAGQGQGATGWVQAPVPGGTNAPEQAATPLPGPSGVAPAIPAK